MSQLIIDSSRARVHDGTLYVNSGFGMDGIFFVDQLQKQIPDNDLVPGWNRGKPRFMNFLDSILRPVQQAATLFRGLHVAFDIDNAAGEQLDRIGEMVGCSRVLPVVFPGFSRTLDDDDDYRLLIRAQIAKNHWDGKYSSMVSIMHDIFRGFDIQLIDNQDCTIKLLVNSSTSMTPVQQQMILSDLLFPHAAGVKMYVQIPAQISAAVVGIVSGVFEIGHSVMPTVG